MRMHRLRASASDDSNARHGHTWWTKRSSPPFVGVMKPNLRRGLVQDQDHRGDHARVKTPGGTDGLGGRDRGAYPLVASNHFTEPVDFAMEPSCDEPVRTRCSESVQNLDPGGGYY